MDPAPTPGRLGGHLAPLLPAAVLLPLYLAWLGHWPLWDAEAWTASATAGSLGQLFEAVLGDRHPPLYFLLVWCVARLSDSDLALRLPSALAAAAAAAMVYRTATRHLSQSWGWTAALLLGLSPFTVCYAASARSGTLTILLGAWMIDATLRLMTGAKPRRAAWELGLAAALGLYTHYAVVLAWGGCLAGLWCTRTSLFRRQLGSLALAGGGAAFLPWALLGLSHQNLTQGQRIAPLVARLEYLQWPLWPLGPSYLPPGGLVLLGLSLVGAVWALSRTGWRGWLLAWLGAALVIPWAWNGDPSTAVKYYLYAPLLPGSVLLAVVGMHHIAKRSWLAGWLAGWRRLPQHCCGSPHCTHSGPCPPPQRPSGPPMHRASSTTASKRKPWPHYATPTWPRRAKRACSSTGSAPSLTWAPTATTELPGPSQSATHRRS
jgi:4-amino-4-deoxy-L-arabinose transferase-like glycosyltransferase